MRNSTLASATFAEWLASRGERVDASPNWGEDDFEYRPIAASSIDHERLATLANEILTAAIRLAALLEVAQRSESRPGGTSHPQRGHPQRGHPQRGHLQRTGVYADE